MATPMTTTSTPSDPSALDDLVAYVKQLAGVEELDPDQDLLDTGLISSLEMVEVLLFVNSRFKVELKPTELVPDNLASIRRMLALVERAGANIQ
jgi:acyl carrier protein